MEYTQVISLVPNGEHFDATAVNEGVWLSQGHLDAIEGQLQAHAATIAGHDEVVNGLNQQLQDQALQAQQAVSDLETANGTISTQTTRIQELEAEVARLQKAPAGGFTSTVKELDEVGKQETPSYADDSNPFNRMADKFIKR